MGKDMTETTKVTIYGASDDLVEVEGSIEGCDEYNAYGEWLGELYNPVGDGESLIIRAEFGKRGVRNDWTISVENGQGFPDWEVRYGPRENDPDARDPQVTITVPAGARLIVKDRQ
jgi:hypothetical protein